MASNNLFDNPTFSDLKIKFNSEEIHAHKAVVCNHSTYFSAALTKDFSEAESGVLDLGDDNKAERVRAMIRHMYNIPYNLGYTVNTHSFREYLLFEIEMFGIGDKYDVLSLRTEVIKAFPSLLHFASFTGANFAIGARAVYANHDARADKSLERMVLDFCFDHMDRLHRDKDFDSMLEEVAPLSGALLRMVWSASRSSQSFTYAGPVAGL